MIVRFIILLKRLLFFNIFTVSLTFLKMTYSVEKVLSCSIELGTIDDM